ncbi:penicillin-binding protein [bacterium (Candidatus Howlettbacteria) CG_4_10_14_0_8_um_filter_40_9]|nr:MAG: penicillin-binding protein [bacterium (Candidatus Howlettbacteria) CG_4_10_14_0_8_um_filter_40_9]
MYRRRKIRVNRFSPSSRKRPNAYRSTRFRSLRDFNIKNIKEFVFSKEGLRKIGIGLAIFGGFMIALFGWYAKDLPTPNKINSRFQAQSTQIFDRNGKLLYEVHGDKNRILVSINDLPDHVKQSAIAIEDKDFYKHSGFDVKGILRATFVNLVSKNRAQGGSTITQQFIKNALLSSEKSSARKIKEIILAIEIEQMYSKDDILQMYLNEIPYGSNAYGIQVAAKTYFDKDAKDLSLAEAATLAALPQAPTYYSPYGQHKDELLARKDTVLDQMAKQGYIKKEEADAAKEQKLAFSGKAYGDITAPHFVMYVKEKLVEKYGQQMAEEGGLKVYTTLDIDKQKIAEEAVAKYGTKNATAGASNSALVATDPKTGQILAMVGSRDFFNLDIDGNVNVAVMDRQPGSSFKPFAYATLFKDAAWGPGSTLYDLKTDFGGGYVPSNYDGKDHGVVSVRTSLQNSFNIPAVKTLYIAGLDETLKTAHSMGITTLNNRPAYGLSLVLGAGEVKLLDMVNSYGTFANKGVTNDTSWFTKIEDGDGKTLEETKTGKGKQVLDPQVAYLISNILSDDASRAMVFGRGGPLTVSGKTVAAKTGTTNDYNDAWTVGYTPSLAAGVWVGNNDGKPMNKVGGSMAAAPIWNYFMKNALTTYPNEQFQRPSGIKTVTIDAITGRKPSAGTKETRTDIFPSWYQLGGSTNVTEVKINKLDGKLATDKCPADIVETKVVNPVNAEIPPTDSAFARWQAPVAAWAVANGFLTGSGDVPTETTTMCDNIAKPTVSITAPTEGDNVEGTFKVRAKVTSTQEIESVNISLGSVLKAAVKKGDVYEAEITPTIIGLQKLKATAEDKLGQTGESAVVNINITSLTAMILKFLFFNV